MFTDDNRKINALGVAVLFASICIIIVIITIPLYEKDYIYWSYLFAAMLLIITGTTIVWYSYLHDNKGLTMLVGVVTLLMLISLTYFVLESHKSNITIVIRPV